MSNLKKEQNIVHGTKKDHSYLAHTSTLLQIVKIRNFKTLNGCKLKLEFFLYKINFSLYLQQSFGIHFLSTWLHCSGSCMSVIKAFFFFYGDNKPTH